MAKQTKKSPQEIKKIALSILEKSDISFIISHGKALAPTTLSHSHGSALTPTSIADLLTLNVYSGNGAEIRPKKGYEIVQVIYGSIRVGHKEEHYAHDFRSSPDRISLEIVGENPLSTTRFQICYKPK